MQCWMIEALRSGHRYELPCLAVTHTVTTVDHIPAAEFPESVR